MRAWSGPGPLQPGPAGPRRATDNACPPPPATQHTQRGHTAPRTQPPNGRQKITEPRRARQTRGSTPASDRTTPGQPRRPRTNPDNPNAILGRSARRPRRGAWGLLGALSRTLGVRQAVLPAPAGLRQRLRPQLVPGQRRNPAPTYHPHRRRTCGGSLISTLRYANIQ